jgi:hypothetical protein
MQTAKKKQQQQLQDKVTAKTTALLTQLTYFCWKQPMILTAKNRVNVFELLETEVASHQRVVNTSEASLDLVTCSFTPPTTLLLLSPHKLPILHIKYYSLWRTNDVI